MKVCCLFEQTATFTNIFRKYGHAAYNCDIENKFNSTFFQFDIFDSIQNDFYNFPVNSFDLVFAFFPCTYFSNQNKLLLTGKSFSMSNWSYEKKQDYANNRAQKITEYTNTLYRMIEFIKVPLIIENPHSTKIVELLGCPDVLHADRRMYGDSFKKPTAYFCYNGVNIQELDTITIAEHKTIVDTKGFARSIINPVYADNLIRHISII